MVRQAVMYGMVAVTLISSASVRAQEAPRRVSLDQAAAMFAANSSALRAARAEASAAAAGVRSSGQAPNPVISATRESIADGDRRAGETYLTLNQSLRWPWAAGARSRAARQATGAALARVHADSLELIHAVKAAYVDAWTVERRQEVLVRIAAMVRQARARGAERYRAGDLSGLDRRRLDLEGLRYDRLLASGQLAVDAARRAFGAVILPAGDRSVVAPAALPEPIAPVMGLATDTLRLLDDHPLVRAARAELALAGAEARAESALLMPAPTLTAAYKRQDDGLAGLLLGAAVPVPLFDRRRGAREVATARVAAAEARLAQVERRVMDQARQALARHAAAAAQLADSTAGSGESGRDLLSIALVTYEGGELDLLDLLATAEAFRELGMLAAQGRAEYWLSRFELERALGGSASWTSSTGENPR